jgi:biopolymer transport protein ExbD
MSSSLRTKRRRRPELPLVPLIDVLVMLVLFAFVTMRFNVSQIRNIVLPKISTAGKNTLTNSVTISIESDGSVVFNGHPVTDEQLVAQLDEVQKAGKDIPILIKADEATQLKKLAFVWDSCRQAGLGNNVHIQTR